MDESRAMHAGRTRAGNIRESGRWPSMAMDAKPV
ncbi:hypothetical protein HNP60_001048 [Sphingobium sp. B1D3A]|uniref:Uncharacterized protein n=1 Tax=Sphingobium lignivorans TaxID=2735886 RepID=A0ABR6NFT9_9SPHN|nr:hypothetical protein [Sphingobium lignivorans]